VLLVCLALVVTDAPSHAAASGSTSHRRDRPKKVARTLDTQIEEFLKYSLPQAVFVVLLDITM
jgi:hypothetical protein